MGRSPRHMTAGESEALGAAEGESETPVCDLDVPVGCDSQVPGAPVVDSDIVAAAAASESDAVTASGPGDATAAATAGSDEAGALSGSALPAGKTSSQCVAS